LAPSLTTGNQGEFDGKELRRGRRGVQPEKAVKQFSIACCFLKQQGL